MTFKIEKADYGSDRWWVVDASGGLLLKCRTKRIAAALATFADAPAPGTYRELFRASDADFAVFAAFRIGVGPTACDAYADGTPRL